MDTYIVLHLKKKSLYISLRYNVLLLSSALWLFSCTERRNTEIENAVRNMQGKYITFPEQLKTWRNDNIAFFDSDIVKEEKSKIIIYFSPGMCMSCNMDKLDDWKELEKVMNEIKFIYILSYNKEEEEDILQYLENGEYKNIILDDDNHFYRNNRFIHKSPILHAFWLNSRNQIELVGDPLFNERLRNLYIEKYKQYIERNNPIE